MTRGRSQRVLMRHWDGSHEHRRPDDLVVEEPLTIRLDGVTVTTTMRTPGHDFELAAGFCFTEGLLGDASVTTIRYCYTEPAIASGDHPNVPPAPSRHREPAIATGYNLVTVETDGAPPATPRLGLTTSSCGLCGTESIETLRNKLGPLPGSGKPIGDMDVLAAVPDRVRAAQDLFDTTGGVHAAAAFTAGGRPTLVREDIGRHNAVDKVVGRLLLDGDLPAHGRGLFVSGRASFEMVQKAWAAGFTTVVAVSAPSSLAVETARAAGLCLAGFARDGRLNLYSPYG
ncbi:formate dehydrogenase accessory sulfurtransferase FdhD [Candidatus Poriferisocius sp.]|uniref:formate dehydrogenase accessory sulfurtransferase FdhD n=1 Tax=Candidatus Poriferisocius sp. TaxID=3101276 RepID=UPI003B01299C